MLSTLGPTRTGIREVSFSVDDRYLAAGQNGGMVHLWEVETNTLVAVLRGHSEKVVSIAFSPDGTTMATASWDGALRLWGLTSLHTPADELVRRFEAAWKLSLEDALSAEVD